MSALETLGGRHWEPTVRFLFKFSLVLEQFPSLWPPRQESEMAKLGSKLKKKKKRYKVLRKQK